MRIRESIFFLIFRHPKYDLLTTTICFATFDSVVGFSRTTVLLPQGGAVQPGHATMALEGLVGNQYRVVTTRGLCSLAWHAPACLTHNPPAEACKRRHRCTPVVLSKPFATGSAVTNAASHVCASTEASTLACPPDTCTGVAEQLQGAEQHVITKKQMFSSGRRAAMRVRPRRPRGSSSGRCFPMRPQSTLPGITRRLHQAATVPELHRMVRSGSPVLDAVGLAAAANRCGPLLPSCCSRSTFT